MMKIRDTYLYLLAAALTLSACTADDMQPTQRLKPIVLTASSEAPVPTRAATDIQSYAFDREETIHAYISYVDEGTTKWLGQPTIYTTAAPQTTTNGEYLNALTPAQQPYFPSTNPPINIFALYPVKYMAPTEGTEDTESTETETDVTADMTTFSVSRDQTGDYNYKRSDLMHALVSNQQTTDQAINLPFTHKMAKVIVNATATEEIHIQSVVLRGICRTIGFSPETGDLGDASTLTDSEGGITIYRNDEGTESLTSAALFPPQTVTGDLIEVNTDKGTAKFSVASKMFEGGKEYTVNIAIGRQAIGFTSTITNWTTDIGTIAVTVQSDAAFRISDEIDAKTFVYTGEPIRPDKDDGVQVVMGTTDTGEPKYLTLGTDYTLEYFNNTNAGTATIIAVGAGGYTNQAAVKSFIIQQREVRLSFTEQPTKSVTYVENGNVTNRLVITTTDSEPKNILLGSMGLGHITYTSSMPGVATVNEGGEVTIHGEGSTTIGASMSNEGNYVPNSITPASYVLSVTKKPISDLSITVTVPSPCYYTGKPITPSITILDEENGKGLTVDQDYTVSLSNNTNAGEATYTITGTGSYQGTVTDTYTILQAPNELSIASTAAATVPVGTTLNRPATANFGTVKYESSNTDCAPVSAAGVVSGLEPTSSPATITVSVDETPNYKGASLTYQVTVMNTEWEFNYKGEVEAWTAPVDGNYKLEVYGAQGGSIEYTTTWWGRTYTQSYSGGQGGYATGMANNLKAGDVLYVCVGGEGAGGSRSGSTAAGGYNGGGGGGSGNACGGSGGGGCTHIAKVTGERKDVAIGNIYLIAGGGGGSGFGATGAAGGGESGGRGQQGNRNVAAANQSSGQSGGVGQTGANATSGWGGGGYYGSGGGGGGYYGGPANTDGSQRGSGSGGSGYTGGVSGGSMKTGSRAGNGYAKITYIP